MTECERLVSEGIISISEDFLKAEIISIFLISIQK